MESSEGAEVVVHAARRFLQNAQRDQVYLKLDFENAFNSLHRDKMLKAVKELAPSLLPYVHSSYSYSSLLFLGDKTLESAEGVQQGDPLGPLLFCLSIHQLTTQLTSHFKVFYLDDGSLGGNVDGVLHNLSIVEEIAGQLGLRLNRGKSEVICQDPGTLEKFLSAAPGFEVTFFEKVTLLGPTSATMLMNQSLIM